MSTMTTEEDKVDHLTEANIWLTNENAALRELVIELADALEQWVKAVGNTHPDWELIHRARDGR